MPHSTSTIHTHRYEADAQEYVTLTAVLDALAQSTVAHYTRALVFAMLGRLNAAGEVRVDDKGHVYRTNFE